MEPAPTAPVRDHTSAYSNGASATAPRFKECGLRMQICILAAEIQCFHLDTHPKLWQNKRHVPLERQHVDTHPVGQRRICGAAVGGATGRRSAGYCVPS